MLFVPLRRLTLLALSSLFLCSSLHSQQRGKSEPLKGTTSVSYPNNADGLRQLLEEMLVAARQNDTTRLQSLIRETEIPNYQNWFITTFGQEKGESWAEPYGKLLQKEQMDFQDLLIRFSHALGEFSTQKVDSAKKYDTLTGALDEYLADWKDSGTQKVHPVAEFFFIQGKFRWNSNVRVFPLRNLKPGSFVPGKLLKRIQPEYPEEARQKRIQGRVVLNVFLLKDGSVRVQNVSEGDPILSPAAIAAVRQWQYEPSFLNGQPIEFQTKITVVFTLNQPTQPQ